MIGIIATQKNSVKVDHWWYYTQVFLYFTVMYRYFSV
ncbi:MAG: hypothetical protein A4E58_03275 [Syntrophorhabdus sp. PtaB.Bin006]|nr:MAG: hypothetical protein A4E58_03275 [Syntrophorhabdus sp. PtaB.Bin006]OPY85044.1 MAG: hypothetical protein A4E65_00206 [Syntrophorhabdus sp. PtaU1.Bin153]